jgi:hypothetical protein
MVDVTLYKRERPGAGLTSEDVSRAKGATYPTWLRPCSRGPALPHPVKREYRGGER